MGTLNWNPTYTPWDYNDKRQTGNPQTQPFTGAFNEDVLGTIREEITESGDGLKRGKFVEASSDVLAGTNADIPVGDVLYYTDNVGLQVTNKLTASGAAITKVAGVTQAILTGGKRGWVLLDGILGALHVDGTSPTAGDTLIASATTATAAAIAGATAPIEPVIGTAIGSKSGNYVAANIHIGTYRGAT